jgi:hypothetical protein
MTESAQGRRVLVAVVTGEPGTRIQAWRERNDPQQARRIPPHATLCYWLPDGDLDALDEQVRHAFPEPIAVRLGRVHEFDNVDRTFYVDVQDAAGLDAARERLFDATYLDLPGRDRHWTWHVTCVRKSIGRGIAELREQAATLALDAPWLVDTIACLELQGDRYEPIRKWELTRHTAGLAQAG